MELTERLGAIEDEVSLLKVEIKTILVDIREELLQDSGPFAVQASPGAALVEPPNPTRIVPERLPDGSIGSALVPGYEAPAQPEEEPMNRIDEPIPFQRTNAPIMSQGPIAKGEMKKDWGVLDIASLGKWAEGATRRIGRRRLEEVLNVYELLTGMPPKSARDALLRMLDLCGQAPEPETVAMNDIVAVLSQLDALFRTNAITEVTVLSLLSDAA